MMNRLALCAVLIAGCTGDATPSPDRAVGGHADAATTGDATAGDAQPRDAGAADADPGDTGRADTLEDAGQVADASSSTDAGAAQDASGVADVGITGACGDGVHPPGEMCFGPRIDIADQGSPTKVHAADLDEDGIVDLVTARFSGGGAGYYRGLGDGTFAPMLDLPGGRGVADVVAGDIDKDGDPDLIVADLTGAQIIGMVNFGGAVLSPNELITIGGQAFTIATGDFNEDGQADAMAANFNRGAATVVLSEDGHFRRATHYATGIEPHGGITHDVDGDGHLDIVMANAGTHDPANDLLTINYGDGTGSFGAAVALEVGNGPFFAAAGDLNQDGLVDIVACNFGTPISGFNYHGGDSVSVLLGTGNRQFAPAIEIPGGNGPNHVRLADIDLDGDLDILTADRGDFNFATRTAMGGATVTIHFNDGHASFASMTQLDLGAQASGLEIADLDRDGSPDLAVAVLDGPWLALFLSNP